MGNHRIFTAVPLLFLLALLSGAAAATELRGRVDGVHPYAPYPFPVGQARVELFAATPRGSVPVAYAYSGGDGMYYFSGIAPGAYNIQVNGRVSFPLMVNPQPYQDVPPILLR